MAGQLGEQARKDAEAMLQLKLPEVTTKKTEVHQETHRGRGQEGSHRHGAGSQDMAHMVKTSAKRSRSEFPGLRKAAILMVMIGDEASSTILRQLDEDEVQEISREIARVGSLTSEEAEAFWKSSTRWPWRTITWSRAASITPRKS